MSRYVLGISALYHDAAAALLCDGEIVAAASEERFSRVKHDAALPIRAIEFCLNQVGIHIDDVEAVVYYEKPLQKFERLLVSQVLSFPKSLKAFHRMSMRWLTDKLWVRNNLVQALGIDADKLLFCNHHLSHAASAFYCSPHEEAAILTADGVGEWATTALYRGGPGGITPLSEIRFPQSIGLVYSAFTAFLGFRVNNGEYKVMGMAAYGEPRFTDKVMKVLSPRDDGSFVVDMSYFSYHYSATDSYNQKFIDLFGEPRFPGDDFDPTSESGRFYADIAASIQRVTEICMVNLAGALHRETGLDALCMAGGVALNSVANRAILTQSPFKSVYVQPAAGDAGSAMGCALWAWNEVLGGERGRGLRQANLGQSFGEGALAELLGDLNIRYEPVGEKLTQRAAEDIHQGKVIAWFQGRFEWGPRALGYRSILADPGQSGMKDRINRSVKFREPFRPFAPSTTAEAAPKYFDLADGGDALSRWMLMVSPVLDTAKSTLPAITHADGTARVQVVEADENPLYHQLISDFGALSGHSALLNTSFNLKGEPMVASPIEALATFQRSEMDVLYLGQNRIIKAALSGGN